MPPPKAKNELNHQASFTDPLQTEVMGRLSEGKLIFLTGAQRHGVFLSDKKGGGQCSRILSANSQWISDFLDCRSRVSNPSDPGQASKRCPTLGLGNPPKSALSGLEARTTCGGLEARTACGGLEARTACGGLEARTTCGGPMLRTTLPQKICLNLGNLRIKYFGDSLD